MAYRLLAPIAIYANSRHSIPAGARSLLCGNILNATQRKRMKLVTYKYTYNEACGCHPEYETIEAESLSAFVGQLGRSDLANKRLPDYVEVTRSLTDKERARLSRLVAARKINNELGKANKKASK